MQKRVVAFVVLSASPLFGLEGFTRPDFQILLPGQLSLLESPGSFPSGSAGDSSVLFNITVNYSGDPAFEDSFTSAAATWMSLMPFYLDGRQGAAVFPGVTIDASVVEIDGPGGILGQAGPQTGGYDDSDYLLAITGMMEFDAADFTSPTATFNEVVLHEMAHVLGLGTLWDYNGLYDPFAASVIDPNNGQTVGRYTGASGLLGWQVEFDPDATFVPVEKGGGAGTADGHWNEGDGGSATGYVSSLNELDSRFELMTGWLNPGSFIGEVTKGSMRDLGYDVVVIPESSGWMLGGLTWLGFALRRRRAIDR